MNSDPTLTPATRRRYDLLLAELRDLERECQREGGFLTSDPRSLRLLSLWEEVDELEGKLAELEYALMRDTTERSTIDVSTDYSDHYAVEGWFDGSGDCEPPEPGKHWLTITEDGTEYALVVVRRPEGVAETDPEHIAREAKAFARAERIAAALNAYREEN